LVPAPSSIRPPGAAGTVTSRHSATALAGIFVTAYATNVSTPFLVAYRDRLELGPSATQTIFVVYVAGILTTLLLSGPASDRFGRKPMCIPFVALSAVASAVIIFGRDSYPLLLVGRLILGVSVGAVLAVGTAWVQELMGPGTQVRAAVLTTVATYGGFGIGPLISGLLDWAVPAPLVVPFLVHIASAAVVIPLLMAVPETRPANPALRAVRINFGVPSVGRRIFWTTVVPAAIWVFAFPSTSFALFPVLLSSATGGRDVQVAAAASTLTAWSGLLARPLLPRFGAPTALVTGMAMGSMGYVLGTAAFWTDGWPLLLPSAMLLGAASGTISAGCLALLGAMAGDTSRGALTSTFYLLAYPSMSMPVVVTSLAAMSSFRTALLIITGAALLGSLVVSFFAWRNLSR
jgi:MFS family permease